MKNMTLTNPAEDIIELFSLREWRQRIRIGDELYTPGSRCEYEWDMCALPHTLQGKTFIDVGANDGMFSFLAEQKGASAVKSVDLYIENDNTGQDMTGGWPISRIKTVKKVRRSNIDIEPCSIYELKKLNQRFDVTYCGNVIAWLQNPMEALNQLSAITTKTLIIREDISKIKNRPVLEFINNKEMNSCMFNGNRKFYETYLSILGFKTISFRRVDEFAIFEKRAYDFPRYSFPKKTRLYKNPFTTEVIGESEKAGTSSATALINDRYFFNEVGWVDMKDASELPQKMIPENPLRKFMFEKKVRKGMLDNTIIVAER